MHILYLHQYFKTPAEGGALRSYYISQALLQAGHRVTLITAHNQPEYKVREVEGITVHYLPVAYANKMGVAGRAVAFVKFMWQSLRVALQQTDIDLVYATSTPLTVGVTALLLKRFRRWKYVFEVRDLWPEAPIQLGFIRNSFLIKQLRILEKRIYRSAEHIIALSPGMEQGVRLVAPQKPVSMLPNMADCSYYRPTEKPQLYAGLPVKERFVISYFGAMGRANRLGFLLDLAEACQKSDAGNLLFLVAGAGAEAEALQLAAKKRGLKHVHFLGELNREEIRELLAASDATYTSFDVQPVLQTNSPNKFFDALAAGKVTLVNTRGWLKELVEENNCGLYLDPLDPEKSAQKVKNLLQASEQITEMQANARALAEREFSREKICAKVVKVVERIFIAAK